MKKRHEQKFILVSMTLFLLLNAPILLLFNSSDIVFGFPKLYFFIFSVWLIAIIITFGIFKRFDE